jgi:biotin transporter BioY
MKKRMVIAVAAFMLVLVASAPAFASAAGGIHTAAGKGGKIPAFICAYCHG